MNIEIFYDGATPEDITLYKNSYFIKGFTTNPTLMRKAGIENYMDFAEWASKEVPHKPISFEVIADDDTQEIIRQADKLSLLGDNIYVKVPIVNSKGANLSDVIEYLLETGIKINITAVMTCEQLVSIKNVVNCSTTPSIVSIFAGRVSDTGRNPVYPVAQAKYLLSSQCKVLWASTRCVYDVYRADQAGCDIITCTQPIIDKLTLKDKDLDLYSRETAQMFYEDAKKAGYEI